MTEELYINGQDAYQQWGVILADGSLTALMTPAPLKQYITNESALIDGKQVALISNALPKVDSRDVQLTIHLHARNMADFLSKYNSFVSELHGGIVDITTKYQPNVRYRCLYVSCQQFSQFNGRLAKFVLKLNEPNPADRSV